MSSSNGLVFLPLSLQFTPHHLTLYLICALLIGIPQFLPCQEPVNQIPIIQMKPHSSSSSRKILSSCSSNNNSCSNGSSSSSSCCPSYVIPVSFVFFIVVLYGEDISCVLRQPFFQFGTLDTNQQRQELQDDIAFPFAIGKTPRGCNVFDGKWVYDEASRPQYEEEECPYIHAQLTCQKQGRPDKGYQHWRWQPHGCSLPSFNASMVLETIRGKRMLYVGDSLNRGQFVSMVCLLHRAIPDPKAKSFATNGSLTIFTAKEYGATVEFYWAPFLAESNSDDAIVHRVLDRIVRVGSVRKHAAYWKGADILVFNTYMWWMTGMKMKILRGPFTGDMKNIKRMETEDAYRVAMRGMVRWVEKNMDPTKTRVFFATMSPAHEKAAEWGGETGDNCLNETEPIGDPSYWGFSSSKSVMQVVVEELGRSRVPFTVLNITQLSDYRKDAHVSIYKKHWNPLTPEQIKNPRTYADCVHWCLPGLQDTWNELLFAKLFFP